MLVYAVSHLEYLIFVGQQNNSFIRWPIVINLQTQCLKNLSSVLVLLLEVNCTEEYVESRGIFLKEASYN